MSAVEANKRANEMLEKDMAINTESLLSRNLIEVFGERRRKAGATSE